MAANTPIYLDHNSTTPIHPEVLEAMVRCWRDLPGNPASQHSLGRKARRILEEARDGVASLLGATVSGMDADLLIFTSGGTEANNLAIIGLTQPHATGRVIVSPLEHLSVLGPAERLARSGFDLRRLPVLKTGVVAAAAVRELLTDNTRLISVMLASNETGVLQPVREIAQLAAERGIPLHCDAAQAVGKIPVHFRDLGVSALTIAAHKFHGPLGIGGLLLRQGTTLQPQLLGGFQQAGLRAGTESAALAIGFYTALVLWEREASERQQRMAALQDALERKILAAEPGAVIVGAAAARLPNTTNVAFPGVNRQALVMALDMAGIACSTGSACASGSSEPSPALLAMGLSPELVEGSIRLSWGAFSSAAEGQQAAERILLAVKQLRR